MLDFPGVVDPELVCEFDLVERFLEQPEFVAVVPRPRQLMLVENPEFHGRILDYSFLLYVLFVATICLAEGGRRQGRFLQRNMRFPPLRLRQKRRLIFRHNALRINHFFAAPKPATIAATEPAVRTGRVHLWEVS